MSETQKSVSLKNVDGKGRKLWAIISIVNFIIAIAVVGYIVIFDFVINKKEPVEPPKVIARYENNTKDRFKNVMSAFVGYEKLDGDDVDPMDKIFNTVVEETFLAWGRAFEEAEVPESTFYKLVVFLETYHGKYFKEGTKVRNYFDQEELNRRLKEAGFENYDGEVITINPGENETDLVDVIVNEKIYAVYVDYIFDKVYDAIFDVNNAQTEGDQAPSIFGVIVEFINKSEEIGMSYEQIGKVYYHGMDQTLDVLVNNMSDVSILLAEARRKIENKPGQPLTEKESEIHSKVLILEMSMAIIPNVRNEWRKIGEEEISKNAAQAIESIHLVTSVLKQFNGTTSSSLAEEIAKTIKNEDDVAGIEAAGKMVQNLLLSYKYQLDNNLQPVYDKNGNIIGTQLMIINKHTQGVLQSIENITTSAVSLIMNQSHNYFIVNPVLSSIELIVNTGGNILINVMSVFEDIEYCKQIALNTYRRYIDKIENRTYDLSNGRGMKDTINFLINSTTLNIGDLRQSRPVQGMYGINLTAQELAEESYNFLLDLQINKIVNSGIDFSNPESGEGFELPGDNRDYYGFAVLLGKALANRAGISFEEYDAKNNNIFSSLFGVEKEINFEEIGNLEGSISDDQLLKLNKSVLVRYFYFIDSKYITLVNDMDILPENGMEFLENTIFKDVDKIVIPSEATQSEIITIFKLISAAFSSEGDRLPVSYLSTIIMKREGFTDKLVNDLILNVLKLITANNKQLEEILNQDKSEKVTIDQFMYIPLTVESFVVNGVVGNYLACKWIDGRYLTLATNSSDRIQIGENNLYLGLPLESYEFILHAADAEITNDAIIIKKGEIKYRLIEEEDSPLISIVNSDISENVLTSVLISDLNLSKEVIEQLNLSKENGTLTNFEIVFEEVASYYRNLTGKNVVSYTSAFVTDGIVNTAGAISYVEQLLREIQLRTLIQNINTRIIYVRSIAPEFEGLKRLDLTITFDKTNTVSDIMQTNHQIIVQLINYINTLVGANDRIEYELGHDFYQTVEQVLTLLNTIDWIANDEESPAIGLGLYQSVSDSTLTRIVNVYNSKVGINDKIQIEGMNANQIIDLLEIAFAKDFGSENNSLYERMLLLFASDSIDEISYASLFIDRLIDTHNSSSQFFNKYKSIEKSAMKTIGIKFFIYPDNNSAGYDFIYYQLYKLVMQYISVSDSPLSFSFLTSAVRAIGSFEITTKDKNGNIIKFGEEGYFEALDDKGATFYAYEKTQLVDERTIVEFEFDWKLGRSIQYYYQTKEDFINSLKDINNPGSYLVHNYGTLSWMWDNSKNVREVFVSKHLFKEVINNNFDLSFAAFSELWDSNWFGIQSSKMYDGMYDFMSRMFKEGSIQVKINGVIEKVEVSKQMMFNALYDDYLDIYKAIIGVGLYITEFPGEIVNASIKQVLKYLTTYLSPMIIETAINSGLVSKG